MVFVLSLNVFRLMCVFVVCFTTFTVCISPPWNPPQFAPAPITLSSPCAFVSDVVVSPITGLVVVACTTSNSIAVYPASSSPSSPSSPSSLSQMVSTPLTGVCKSPTAVATYGMGIFAACSGQNAVMYWSSISAPGILFSDTRCSGIIDIAISASSGILVGACVDNNKMPVMTWNISTQNAQTTTASGNSVYAPYNVTGNALPSIPGGTGTMALSVDISSLTGNIVVGTINQGVLFYNAQNASAPPTILNGTCADISGLAISSLTDSISAACQSASQIAYWSSHSSPVVYLPSTSCLIPRDTFFHPVNDQVYAACEFSTAAHWSSPSLSSSSTSVPAVMLNAVGSSCSTPVALSVTSNANVYLACANNLMIWLNSTGNGVSMPGACSSLVSVTRSPLNGDVFAACETSSALLVWRNVNLTSLLLSSPSSSVSSSSFVSTVFSSYGSLLNMFPSSSSSLSACLDPAGLTVSPQSGDLVAACRTSNMLVKWTQGDGLPQNLGACSGALSVTTYGNDVFAACPNSNSVVRLIGGATSSITPQLITLNGMCQGAGSVSVRQDTGDLYAACVDTNSIVWWSSSSGYSSAAVTLNTSALCQGIRSVQATPTGIFGTCSSTTNLLLYSFPSPLSSSPSLSLSTPRSCTGGYAMTQFGSYTYAACANGIGIFNSTLFESNQVTTTLNSQCVPYGVSVSSEGLFVACRTSTVLAYFNAPAPPGPLPASPAPNGTPTPTPTPAPSSSGGVPTYLLIIIVVGAVLVVLAVVVVVYCVQRARKSKSNFGQQTLQMNPI